GNRQHDADPYEETPSLSLAHATLHSSRFCTALSRSSRPSAMAATANDQQHNAGAEQERRARLRSRTRSHKLLNPPVIRLPLRVSRDYRPCQGRLPARLPAGWKYSVFRAPERIQHSVVIPAIGDLPGQRDAPMRLSVVK